MLKKLSVILLFCTSSCVLASQHDEEFTKLAEHIWQYSLQASPIAAGYDGFNPTPSKMPEISEAALKVRFEERTAQLKLLENIHLDKLSEQNQINYEFIKHRLQNEIDGYVFKAYQVPLTAEGGFHTTLGFIPSIY